MMGRSHLACGVVAGVGMCAGLPVPPKLVPLVVLVVAYSALVPDADHWSAPAARCLGPLSWGICWTIRAVSVRTTGDAHRGISHSLAFALAWSVLVGGTALGWFPVPAAGWLALSAFVGCVTHLLGDWPTKTGLYHVLWPLEVRAPWPYALRFRVGSRVEDGLMIAVAVAGVWCASVVLS